MTGMLLRCPFKILFNASQELNAAILPVMFFCLFKNSKKLVFRLVLYSLEFTAVSTNPQKISLQPVY